MSLKRWIGIYSLILTLMGCGSGREDFASQDPSTQAVSRNTFNIQAAWQSQLETGFSKSLYISGSCLGNLQISQGPAVPYKDDLYSLTNTLFMGTVYTYCGPHVIPPTSDLAGTYNFITVQCGTKSNGVYTNCATYYGTVEVTAATGTTATFRSCVGADITTGTGSCTSNRSGTLTYLSNGVWAMKDSASTFNNYMLAFQAPNGQKVGWLDFNDATVFGYGQGVVSQRTTLNTYSGIDGSYFYKNTIGTSGSVTLSANANTQQITGSSGIVVAGNQPWAGFGKSATGYGLMAGNGIYVYMDHGISNAYYEIGIQK